jgi:hypothetical protein
MFYSLFLAAGLAQALGAAVGLLQAIGFVASVACLIAAALGGMSERGLQGIKISLILAVIAALAFLIAQALFVAGGANINISPTAIN